MADQVKVTSIDALESFRASVIIFLTKAHNAVDDVTDEVRRKRMWLQNDQRLHWEGELRRRRRILDLAVQELMTARLSNLRDNISAQENAVRKAKHAVAEAEDKLRAIKRWTRDYDHYSEPLTKKLESLRQFLDYDMPKAIAYLLQAQKTLEAYTESAPKITTPPPVETKDET
jgi:hypothetical protein